MATWEARPVIFSILFSLLLYQGAEASSLPLRLILEPILIDLRIRAASVFNRAGLGLGGILSKTGEFIHKVLGDAGKFIQGRLNNLSKKFQDPNAKTDVETGLYRALQSKVQSQLDSNGFPMDLPPIKEPVDEDNN